MPNPTIDDLTLSRAYLLWANAPEPGEDRRETLPDREVEITVPAMAPYPEQVVKLGEELHSFLNPANPGAGPKLVVALGTGDVPVDNLKGLGWHIHPGILNENQLAKWASSRDLMEAGWIHQLYEEERATRGYLPSRIDSAEQNEKRKNSEPAWSVATRQILHRSRAGKHPLGPAAAWALIDNDIPVLRSQTNERVQIQSKVPLDSERAARERGEMLARNIRALYDWGIIPSGQIATCIPTVSGTPKWVQGTIKRIEELAREKAAAATKEKPEIDALTGAGRFTLKPSKSGKAFKISTDNLKRYPVANIMKNLDQLQPDLREYGPDGPPQQAALGAAEPAPQLGASYGQPPASPTLRPSAPPFPQAFPPNPTWAEATRAFSPPVPSGNRNPSPAPQEDMPSRAVDQQQGTQRKKMRT
ncbi:hypothetical protein ACQEU8_03860 [Streptomyces sp. CA-250714]|uniref:hypothetical protein n=1 Tax=Streptomyces sp. CA-250714 TaxID=3240060 RepID=UPI003D8F9C03